jgi:HEAT repeat protein
MEPGEQVPDSPRPVVEREVLQVVDTPDPIPSALPSEEPVRAFAVRGVGAFGAVEFIPTLIGMLKDPSAEVREAVVDAVKQLSSQPAPKQEAQAEAGS